MPQPKGEQKDQFHEEAQFRRFAQYTEGARWEQVGRQLKFHRAKTRAWQHPRDLGGEGVSPFLTYLAAARDAPASLQNQALNALVFLYREVL